MKNQILIIVLFTLAGLFALVSFLARAELSAAKAREHLQNGALMVDVRTVEEFDTKRLTQVVNIRWRW